LSMLPGKAAAIRQVAARLARIGSGGFMVESGCLLKAG
jgi:hypothetical protein